MSFARSLAMSLCASVVLLGGCLADAEEEVPTVGQDEAALIQEPFCVDSHTEEVEYVACGIKPNGMPAKKKCTTYCTTPKHLDLFTHPATCVVGLTACHQSCDPCPY